MIGHSDTSTVGTASDKTRTVPSPSSNQGSGGLAAFQDAQTILAAYDKDDDNKLDADELSLALSDYANHKESAATAALARYDQDSDGDIEGDEVQALYSDLDTSETLLQYLTFTGSLATMGKIVRALNAADSATSKPQLSSSKTASTKRQLVDVSKQGRIFWESARGRLLQLSWHLTYGYALTDSLWEGYKHLTRKNDYDYDQGARHMISRACFNASMVYTSMYTVKYTVQFTHKLLPVTVGPRWVLPCFLSTVAVIQIPHLVAKPLKETIQQVFGAKTKQRRSH